MKTERLQFLVTVTVTHDGTKSDRRAAVAEAKETIQCASGGVYELKHNRVVLFKPTKHSKTDSYHYFYTYLLPFSGGENSFTYWRAKNADEALGLALSLYSTTQFHIEGTTAAEYKKSRNKGN